MDGDQFLDAWLAPAPRGREAAPQSDCVSLFLRRDFSDQAIRRPAEPAFSQADMAEARREGFDAGRLAGLDEAAASRAAMETETLRSVAAVMAESQAEAARIADASAEALAKALVAAMDAVMPDLIRRSALGEAGAMLAHVLPGLSREPRVHVEIPDDIAAGVAAAIARLTLEHRDRIEVTASDGMTPGEARVRWASGQASRRPAGIWRDVMDLLEPAMGEPKSKDDDNDD